MSEHQSARRSHRVDGPEQQSRFQESFQDDESLDQPEEDDAYMNENEKSLAVDPPVFDTPSRRRRDVHPTLRIFRPSEVRQQDKGRKDSNIIAYESDEEVVDAGPNKRSKNVNGHARNPFAATSRETNDRILVTHRPYEQEHQRHGLTAKSRLLQPPKASVIVLDPSSDPPEADMDEVELVSVPPRARSRTAVGESKHPNKKPRLAGGKRHEIVPEMFKKPRVDEKAAAFLGNRASGPKYGRRAV
jgi:hypothetical protein